MAKNKEQLRITTFDRAQLEASGVLRSFEYKVDLSICLVNWNTREMLKACIESIIRHHGDLKIEIFVIDNASTDGSVEMVENNFPDIHLIKNSENYGFAFANNQGIRKSRGRHVLLLNPDTQVLPGTIEKMVDFLDSHPDTGAVAPKLLNGDGSLQYSIRGFPTFLTPFTENPDLANVPFILRHTNKAQLKQWDHQSSREVEQPAGAAIMIKRAVFETLGDLDETYHMFFEDVDLCYRIKQNGWRIYYLSEVCIIHYGGQSVKQRRNISDEFYKSMVTFFYKHFDRYGGLKIRLSMVTLSMVYVLYALGTSIRHPSKSVKLALNALRVFNYGIRYTRMISAESRDFQ